MHGLLCWIGTPQSPSALLGLDLCSSMPVGALWPGFAPLNFILCSSITISTPLAHPALHMRNSYYAGSAPLFPPNSECCRSNSILIHRELTSPFQPFRFHKSSQTTLELNGTRLPGPNHSEIQWVHSASECREWIVCSCVCRPWWDRRSVDDIQAMFHWYHSIA